MSTIAFVCPNGHQLNAPRELAGKPGKCPHCGSKFLIPTLEEAASANEPETAPSRPVRDSGTQKSPSQIARNAAAASKSKRFKDNFAFLCPNGHQLNGPSSLKGKPGKCPHCGAKFLIPSDDDQPHENPEEEVPTGEVVEGNAESHENYEPLHQAPIEPEQQELAVVEVATTWQLPPPVPAGGHRLAELFTWLWAQREPKSYIELIMKDGQTFAPKLFAPELSQHNYGVFAMRDDLGKFAMTTLCWDNVSKVVVRNLDEIPHALFE